ncbi:MAG: hypothetical protein GWN62_04940, partial [Aliifodinibius sp.]|nr:hypothetical protein [Fodinibius sp.]
AKSALFLVTLENYLGRETMQEILRTYFQRWKFKHPRTQDFVNTVNDVSGQNLTSFFDQALHTTAILDYSVDKVFTRRYREERGFDFDFQAGTEDSVVTS